MHIVPFKLKEDAREFSAGDYTGFGIRTGVKHQDKTKQDKWTNYEAAIFSKSPAQIDFYRSNLVAGALVVVSADNLEVSIFEGKNGAIPTIKMINANVKAVHSGSSQQSEQPRSSAPRGNAQPQQAPVAATPAGFDDFDDSIHF